MASKQEIQNVIDATDIVSLVSEYVKLDKQGKNYKGLCPFHHEDTPSFVVNQEKKIAHCFGCGGGGDPVKFLMQIESIDFNQALNKLATRNGIKLTDFNKNIRSNPLTKYYKIMQTSQAFYKKFLENTDYGLEAISYLNKRGLNEETIKVFGIGLAPFAKDSLYQVLKESNYLELDMLDVGLVDKSSSGYYDIFTRRIMFPVCNEAGDVIAYSGRIFNNTDKNQPKYVNSRETLLFKKKDVLFNLHLAKGEILRKKRVIIHEGQMDVIASYRSGLKEAVCTMGTALSIDQAMILKKYTNHAVICYDGDKAGINASLKAINVFESAGFIVHLVLLPNGMDPDEFVLKNGTAEYAKYFESNLIDSKTYIFNQAVLNKNLSDSIVLDTVKHQVFDMIYSSHSKTVEEDFLLKLSDKIGCSLDAIVADYQSYCNLLMLSKNVDFYKDDKNDNFLNQTKKIIEEEWLSKYETRLFIYAKSSKNKALYIDRFLSDKMSVLSLNSQSLWITLVNNYYERFDEFDEKKFIKLLSQDGITQYEKILSSLKNDIDPYTDDDLNSCLEKLNEVKYGKRNIELSSKLSKVDDDEQVKIVGEIFKNKKNIDLLKKQKARK